MPSRKTYLFGVVSYLVVFREYNGMYVPNGGRGSQGYMLFSFRTITNLYRYVCHGKKRHPTMCNVCQSQETREKQNRRRGEKSERHISQIGRRTKILPNHNAPASVPSIRQRLSPPPSPVYVTKGNRSKKTNILACSRILDCNSLLGHYSSFSVDHS